MFHARWVGLLGWMGVASILAVACGEESSGDDTSNRGGAAGEGASAGAPSQGGAAGEPSQGGAAGEPPQGAAGASEGPGCSKGAVCDYSSDPFLECPISLQDYDPPCSIYGGIYVDEYDSKCGGTVIEASDGVQTTDWTFAPSGELVGTTWSGDVGDTACWGEPCAKVGSPRLLCDGSAGAGGAASGDGGAGGNGGGGG